jgi:hypothetical protein
MQKMNAGHLTVRNVPPGLSAALEREKKRRGTSLNQTVIDLLQTSLGVGNVRSNGLAKLAGTWSEKDHRDFLKGVAQFEQIDPEMWK